MVRWPGSHVSGLRWSVGWSRFLLQYHAELRQKRLEHPRGYSSILEVFASRFEAIAIQFGGHCLKMWYLKGKGSTPKSDARKASFWSCRGTPCRARRRTLAGPTMWQTSSIETPGGHDFGKWWITSSCAAHQLISGLGDDFGQPLLKHFHLLALTHTYNSFLGLLLLLLLVFLLSLLTLTSGFCNKLFTYSNIWLL